MTPSNIFRKEIIETLRNRKLVAIKMVFPFLIVLSMLMGTPPLTATAGLITMLVVFIGVFGTGIGIIKEKTDGMFNRIIVTPLTPRRIILENLLAGVVIEFVQFSPILIAVIAIFSPSPEWIISLFLSMTAAVVTANVIGLIISSLSSSMGEVHLYSALSLFPVFATSGIFTPLKNSVQVYLAFFSPFAHLKQALLAVFGKPYIWAWHSIAAADLVMIAILLVLTLIITPRLVRVSI